MEQLPETGRSSITEVILKLTGKMLKVHFIGQEV